MIATRLISSILQARHLLMSYNRTSGKLVRTRLPSHLLLQKRKSSFRFLQKTRGSSKYSGSFDEPMKLFILLSFSKKQTFTLMSRSLRKSMTTTIPIHPKKTDINFPLIWTSPRIGTSSSKMSKLLRSKATVRVGGRRQILSDEDDFVGSAARNVNLTLTGKIANKYLDSKYKQSVLASD